MADSYRLAIWGTSQTQRLSHPVDLVGRLVVFKSPDLTVRRNIIPSLFVEPIKTGESFYITQSKDQTVPTCY